MIYSTVVAWGQQYNVREKSTVIMYTYLLLLTINAGTQNIV